jgi:hypothetical protein
MHFYLKVEGGRGLGFYLFIFCYFYTIWKFFVIFLTLERGRGAWVLFHFCQFLLLKGEGGRGFFFIFFGFYF